MIIQNWFNL